MSTSPGATRDIAAFVEHARSITPDPAQATAQAVFLVAPDAFQLAEQSASDNRYMDLGVGVDPARAVEQHRGLREALAATLPTLCFAGDPRTPDAIFPNNVFATVAARDGRPAALVLGHMRHPVRQREAERHSGDPHAGSKVHETPSVKAIRLLREAGPEKLRAVYCRGGGWTDA